MWDAENQLFQLLAQKNIATPSSIIAIDEVGRGCVAGDVVVGLSLWQQINQDQKQVPHWLSLINDSKLLTPKKRAHCFQSILEDYKLTLTTIPIAHYSNKQFFLEPQNLFFSESHLHLNTLSTVKKKSNNSYSCISFCLGFANVHEIDCYNIWNAIQIAAVRSLLYLSQQNEYSYLLKNPLILMDGKLPIKLTKEFTSFQQVTVTGADALFKSVGFSSILAKVYRDYIMCALDHSWPQFDFKSHKGYGTPKHLKLIRQHGLSPWHRSSFLKDYQPELKDDRLES